MDTKIKSKQKNDKSIRKQTKRLKITTYGNYEWNILSFFNIHTCIIPTPKKKCVEKIPNKFNSVSLPSM